MLPPRKVQFERRISILPLQVRRALSGGYGGCLCQWELKAPTDRSQSDCVHEQVAKADCECPIYITYTNVNGYLIPNLTYKSGEQMEQLGKYGFLRRDYLKNHRNSTYQVMLLQDTIGEHLLEVDKAARERDEVILKQLEKKEPLPDKEKDQIVWV